MRIFLINLDSDVERLAAMKAQLDRLGLAYERFPAIRGGNLPKWLRPYLEGAPISPGEIGCYASHLSVMRMVADGTEPALVLEDDIEIKPEFPALIGEILASKEPWDIVRLSRQSRRPHISRQALSGGHTLVKYLRVPDCTGAYFIRPEGARKFLQWRIPRTRPVDIDLMRVWENQLTTLGVMPLPITQESSLSTIDLMGGRNKRANRQSAAGKSYDNLRRFAYNIASIGVTDTFGVWLRRYYPVRITTRV